VDGAYLSWVHDPERVYRPLDRLHQSHCALAELLDQKFLLSNPDSMFTGAWNEMHKGFKGEGKE